MNSPDTAALAPWSRLAVCPHVRAVTLDGQAVLYHDERGTLHELNPTGTVVWELIARQPRSPDELVRDLADVVPGLPERAPDDIVEYLRLLVQEGLVAPFDEDSP